MTDEEETTDIAVHEGFAAIVYDQKWANDATKALLAKTPARYQRWRGDGAAYLPWQFFAERLTKAFGAGGWGFVIPNVAKTQTKSGSKPEYEITITLELRIMVTGATYTAYGAHVYREGQANQSYAWALQSAKSKALRAAAMNLGIGADAALEGLSDQPAGEGDAKKAWRSACSRHKVGEQAAIALLAAEMKAPFTKLDELLDAVATDGDRVAAYWTLIDNLNELVKKGTTP